MKDKVVHTKEQTKKGEWEVYYITMALLQNQQVMSYGWI